MHIVILGAGSIGRIFGAHLSQGGNDVTFVEPQAEIVNAINHNGIGLMKLDVEDPGTFSTISVKAVSDAGQIQACDYVIIAVKSFDTLAAIKSVAHLVSDTSPVVSLQTGLENIEIMERIVPRENILGGYTMMAGTALGSWKVKHGGYGKTYIGELDGKTTSRVEKLQQVLTQCGIETEVVDQIIGRLWCKVIVYSAINTISAILRIKNGELLDRMESINLMKRLIDEGREVAEACSIDLGHTDLYDLLFDSCRRSYNTLSPMLQDILNNKRTEIGHLNEALCRYGAKHGVSLPTHHTIVQIIKLLEKRGKSFDQPV